MAQPQEYSRQFNFTNFQALQPTAPLPGDEVDNELNEVKITLDEIRARLALIQRDDGLLANGSVGVDQLVNAVTGLAPPSNWFSGTNYSEDVYVLYGGAMYRALVDHTSTSFATDLANNKWYFIFDFGAESLATGADRVACEAAAATAQSAIDAIGGLSSVDGGRADSDYTSTDPFDGGSA